MITRKKLIRLLKRKHALINGAQTSQNNGVLIPSKAHIVFLCDIGRAGPGRFEKLTYVVIRFYGYGQCWEGNPNKNRAVVSCSSLRIHCIYPSYCQHFFLCLYHLSNLKSVRTMEMALFYRASSTRPHGRLNSTVHVEWYYSDTIPCSGSDIFG